MDDKKRQQIAMVRILSMVFTTIFSVIFTVLLVSGTLYVLCWAFDFTFIWKRAIGFTVLFWIITFLFGDK